MMCDLRPSPARRGRAYAVVALLAIIPWAAIPAQRARAEEPVASQWPQGVGYDAGTQSDPPAITVNKEGTVEMHVADLALSTVLEALSMQGRRNIIATPNVQGTVTAHLYGVTFEEALHAVLASNGAGYREVGNFIYVYTNGELDAMISAETPLVTRIFPLHFSSATDALAVITPMLSPLGSVTATSDTDEDTNIRTNTRTSTSLSNLDEDFGSDRRIRNYVSVRDRREVLESVEQILRTLDIPPSQVLVEATILAVKLNEDNSLGVDFTVVGGVDFGALATLSNGAEDIELGDISGNSLDRLQTLASTSTRSIVPEGGLTFGLVKDHVAVFVRALESITDTVVLANPKVLALNRQWAQVIVGHRDGFITTTVTETQAIQNVEFLETGTQLLFRPFIGDNGMVRLELHPEDSVGSVVNGLPTEQTTEVTTNVLVRDGETILIGGLFREVTTDTRNQVPLLGDVPGVGVMFRGTKDQTLREEIIILLTVHIVDNQFVDAKTMKEAGRDDGPLRIGLRRDMMGQGRRNLAKEHYWKAIEHQAAHDADQAMWHARMALQNDPRFNPAAELREEILANQRLDEMRAETRSFLHQLLVDRRTAFPKGESSPSLEPTKTNGSREGETHGDR